MLIYFTLANYSPEYYYPQTRVCVWEILHLEINVNFRIFGCRKEESFRGWRSTTSPALLTHGRTMVQTQQLRRALMKCRVKLGHSKCLWFAYNLTQAGDTRNIKNSPSPNKEWLTTFHVHRHNFYPEELTTAPPRDPRFSQMSTTQRAICGLHMYNKHWYQTREQHIIFAKYIYL